MKTLIKIIAGLIVLAIVAVVALYLSLDKIIKKGVTEAGNHITKTEMTVEKVTVGLFSGQFGFDKFFMGNPEGFSSKFAFKVDKLDVQLDIASVTSDTVHIKHIQIDGAELCFEGLKGDNQQKILENIDTFVKSLSTGEEAPKTEEPAAETPETEAKPGKKIIIDLVEITNTQIHLFLLGKKIGAMTLPSVTKKDIGKGSAKTTPEAIKEVYESIFKGATKAIESSDHGSKGVMGKLKNLF